MKRLSSYGFAFGGLLLLMSCAVEQKAPPKQTFAKVKLFVSGCLCNECANYLDKTAHRRFGIDYIDIDMDHGYAELYFEKPTVFHFTDFSEACQSAACFRLDRMEIYAKGRIVSDVCAECKAKTLMFEFAETHQRVHLIDSERNAEPLTGKNVEITLEFQHLEPQQESQARVKSVAML